MPATRSRTENWQAQPEQIHQRARTEITLPRYIGKTDTGVPTVTEDEPGSAKTSSASASSDMDNASITVDQPMVLGRTIDLKENINPSVIAVGQNRWMFRTRVLAVNIEASGGHNAITGLRLKMPTNVDAASVATSTASRPSASTSRSSPCTR